MQDAAFLVIDVPAHETVLGRLTVDSPLTVDLVGRPEATGEVHGYLVDFTIRPMTQAQAADAAAALRPLYERFEAAHDGDTWHVRGMAPLRNIQVPALRMIAGLYGLTHAPWLTIREGRAQAVMRPRDDESAPMLATLVQARLAQMHMAGNVSVEMLDTAPYDERRRRLAETETSMAK